MDDKNCCLGGFIATMADYLLGLHPLVMVENGVSSFNGSLVGTVLPALFHLVSGIRPTPTPLTSKALIIRLFRSEQDRAMDNCLYRIPGQFLSLLRSLQFTGKAESSIHDPLLQLRGHHLLHELAE